jgi:type I restriction enzyme S subunit
VLPELPKSWTYRHFQDILDVHGGSQPPKSTFVFEPTPGYVQLLQIRDFGDRGVPTFVQEDLITKRCEEEDILIARYGASLGRIVTGQAGAYNVALAKVIFDKSVFYGKCLYYLLQTPFFQTPLHMISRSAQNGFNKGDLSDIVLPVVPLNEQRRIVAKIEELFSDLDAGVAALERAKANLKRYRAAVLKAAVEGKLTEAWRAAHPDTEPASKLLERILAERRQKWEADQLAKFANAGKQPPKNWRDKYVEPTPPETNGLPELPEGWCWATLPQLGVLDRGRSRHRPRNAPHLYDGPYPFIQTGDIRHADTFIHAYHQTYSEAGLEQSRLWPPGTLCITIAANIAATAILGFDACFPDSVVGFNPLSEAVSVRFVEFFFRTVQQRLEAYAPATAQKNINLETLTEVCIPLPPKAEQALIVSEVDARLSTVAAAFGGIERSERLATRLRQSILRQAFEGKLVPQDPNDEPASVLLERLSLSILAGDVKPIAGTARRRRTRPTSHEGENS